MSSALLRRPCWCISQPQALHHRLSISGRTQSALANRAAACRALNVIGNAPQNRFFASKVKGKKENAKEGKIRGGKGGKADVEEASGRGKRGKEAIDTAQLVSGSQRPLTLEDQAEYERTDERMGAAVDWFRREVASMEARGIGRVTPDLLKPVRVTLPAASNAPVSLQEVATVGVRDGTTLVVSAFEDNNLRHIEKAIYAAQIPHVAPQKLDNRTLKIPLPKPTVNARVGLVKSAAKLAEDTRVQLRRHEQTSVKKMKYEKHSLEIEQFHDLLQRHVKNVDNILAHMKNSLGVK